MQFAVVGGIGFLVDQSVLWTLLQYGGITLEIAKIVAAESAIVVMFLVNDRWTFSRYGRVDVRSRIRRLVKSNLVRIGGITVAVVVLSVLVRGFGMHPLVANTIGIGCGFLVNYTFETLFTWRVGDALAGE